MKKLLVRLIVLVVLLSMLAACAPATAPTAAPTEGVAAEPTAENLNDTKPVVVALPTDIVTFEPMEIATKTDSSVANHLFGTLARMDSNLHLVPMMAESWELLDTPQKNIWQFKLRQDITFSNGEPFNAETVKFVIDRGLNPNNAFKGNTPGFVFSSIGLDRLEVVDDYTVNFVLKGYSFDAPYYIAEIYMHPVKYYQDNTNEFVAVNPIGAGPYVLKEWVKDDHMVLERREDYWGEKPAVKTLIFRPFPESSTAVAELLIGNVDVVAKVPPDQADTIDASGVARMEAITGGRRMFVGFFQKCEGPGCEEVRDVRVRQALNYAVDMQKILDGLFYGKATRGAGVANPPYALEDLKPYPYDPEKAKQLLAEAGYPNGFKTTLATPTGRYQKDKELAIAIAADLAKVGVEAEVIPYDWAIYSQMTRSKELPALFLLGMGSNFSGPWYDMSGFSSGDSTTNYPQWQNDEWDALYERFVVAYADDERKAITDAMQRLLHREVPWLFIYNQVDWYAVNENLNWKARPDELIEFVDASWK